MAKINDTESNNINLISNGTEITGDIKSQSDIRIDGSLNGNLSTQGKVVIGTTGKVSGKIICKDSEVAGKIEGKITVRALLTLKATSNINGDIITSKLSIEPGAKFSGKCDMSNGNELKEKTERVEKTDASEKPVTKTGSLFSR